MGYISDYQYVMVITKEKGYITCLFNSLDIIG